MIPCLALVHYSATVSGKFPKTFVCVCVCVCVHECVYLLYIFPRFWGVANPLIQ